MILHIPHSSINTLNKKFLCDVNLELDRMTDIDTDKLFDFPNATKIVFPISRLICDVERFEDDNMEEMAKKGMGVCYTTNSFGKPLRKVSDTERSEIIKKFYQPHHKALTEAVEEELRQKGAALVIDCHSFSNVPLPHEDDKTTPRPDICIGIDNFHTPKELINEVVEYFKYCGYSVAINSPFSGTLIPMKYYQKDKNVQGIMIELNRNLYIDKSDFERLKNELQLFLFKLLRRTLNSDLIIKDILKNGVQNYSIFDIFSFDELLEYEDDIQVFELDNLESSSLEYDYYFTDDMLLMDEYHDYDKNEIITDEMRIEYGMRYLNKAIEYFDEASSLIHAFKKIVVDSEEYLVCYDIQYSNHGMGGEFDYYNAALIGVFLSYEELKNYYRKDSTIIVYEECDEECIKKKAKCILDNWEK